MATVGDLVQVASRKLGQPPREGVVTGVIGRLLQVRWSTGEESTIVPGAGSVSIGGKARGRSRTAKAPARAAVTASRPVRKAPAKSASAKKSPAKVAKATKSPAKVAKATKAPAKKAAPRAQVSRAQALAAAKKVAKPATKKSAPAKRAAR